MAGFIYFILIVVFVGVYWPWIVGVVGVAVIVWLVRRGVLDRRAAAERERKRRADLVARADRQHAWVLAGDERGTYGEPVERDRPAPRRRRTEPAPVVVRSSGGVTVTVKVT